MAKSKYEFKRLKAKPLPAKIIDSTAVRVLATAAKKLSTKWKKFVLYAGGIIGSARVEAAKITDSDRLSDKIEANQTLIDTIKNDENATSKDFKVMATAQAENEKLAGKLAKLMKKKVVVTTKKGESVDLNAVLNDKEDLDKEKVVTTLSDLGTSLDAAGAGKAVVEPIVVEAAKVEEPIPVQAIPVVVVNEQQVVTPVSPVVAPKPVVDQPDLTQENPFISKIKEALDSAKVKAAQNQTLTVENQKLAAENKTKDEKVITLEAVTQTLSTQNQTLTNENQTLQQTNATQAVSIANLARDSETLAAKISEVAKQQEAQAKESEIKMYGITKERDYYKNLVMSLGKYVDLTGLITPPTTGEESKTR